VPPTLRRTARVVPVNRDGQVLLLFGCDPRRPESPYWFTIGGATETGESLEEAGARELFEETGIEIAPDHLVGPYARGRHDFSWGGREISNDSHFFAVRVDDVTVSFDHLEGLEVGSIFEARWWHPVDLADAPLSNPDLPAMAEAAVAAVTA
jgi:8-oxo-dGTP pyrophosphatase MutT (NUDIX family)